MKRYGSKRQDGGSYTCKCCPGKLVGGRKQLKKRARREGKKEARS